MLSEEAKKVRREYDRQYRITHREQIKENNRRYWERKAARMKAEQEAQNATGKNENN